MLYSKSYIFTLKETPRDAEIISHQLMLRAGLIRKSAAGLYTWMPLGKRVLDKVIAITKQEMDKVGALEVLLPFVTQGELWQESGRWDTMGKEMLRFKDRHDHDFVLGPTHEEAFTQIIRDTAQSYQDLPVNLYQINTKFRDEIRPRYGMIRCREFIMKDAYSFDLDSTGLDNSYQAMKQAYLNIFHRVGLTVDPVLADSGNIGGSGSEEFMVPSAVGDDDIVKCSCGYVANSEKAESIIPKREIKLEQQIEKIHTPGVKTIEDLAKFFNCDTKDLVKSFVIEADGKLVMACIRGDLQINETKLQNLLNAIEMTMAEADVIYDQTKSPIGFLGAKDWPTDVVLDESILDMHDTVVGANEKDMHWKGVSVLRDCKKTLTGNFHNAEENHLCISCQKPLQTYKGIEVGHIFKLGTKYAEAMKVTVLDRNNQEVYPVCGCYGIGIGRVIAAVVEQGSDANGIIFPISIAPYHVIITPILVEGELFEEAKNIYKILQDKQIEVILDDRKERVGSKFKDADLIGIPIRITVGRSWQDKQEFEVKIRRTGELLSIPKDVLLQQIEELISKEYEVFNR
ncbi:MAG: proline--tRNA ligase [Spirochaetota bacterium]|nr:proline--tRNA ligase [Spirochaetota bacterium]